MIKITEDRSQAISNLCRILSIECREFSVKPCVKVDDMGYILEAWCTKIRSENILLYLYDDLMEIVEPVDVRMEIEEYDDFDDMARCFSECLKKLVKKLSGDSAEKHG